MREVPVEEIRAYTSNTLDSEIRFAEEDIKQKYRRLHNYIRNPQLMISINESLDRLYRELNNLHKEKLNRILLCKISR